MATSFLAPYIADLQVAAATKPTLNVVSILITFDTKVNEISGFMSRQLNIDISKN